MKKIIGLLLLTYLAIGAFYATNSSAKELKGTISLSGAWAIYPTAVAWAHAFEKKHPDVRVEVSAGGAGKGAADAISGLVDIGMVSRDPDPSELKRGITPIYVLHDAVFPVINEKNPVLDQILKKGVKKKSLAGVYISGLVTSWDSISGKSGKSVNAYTRSDSCGAGASWAKFFGKKQEELKGIGVYGDPGLLETVRRDPNGIGYNNFSYVFSRDGKIVKGVRIVPVDTNENGKADANEIIANRADAVKAIEGGEFPLTRKNYFYVKGKPKSIVREFLEFILSDEGAKIVRAVDTSLPVPDGEREKILKSLK